MTKQEQQFQNRMLELANTAYRRGVPVFTGFLDRNELHMLHSIKELPYGIRVETFGGYEFAERQMAVFLSDAPFIQHEYPFVSVKIEPLHAKFAEALTHRDYLGAVLNLGIDRSQIGDLIVEAQSCILFCTPQIGAFLAEECTRIRHTVVTCGIFELQELKICPHFKEVQGSVSSPRLDSILALAFHCSRNGVLSVIRNGEVFINSRMEMSASRQLKEKDVVSARGYGKFIFDGVVSETKKGRLMVHISVFD